IFVDASPGVPFHLKHPESLVSFSHNLFHVSDGWLLAWGDEWFKDRESFESAFPEFAGALLTGDPMIGNFPEPFPLYESPVVDSGVALSPEFARDRLGQERPIGEAWDIGPYEVPISPPLPPTNLRIQVNRE